MEKNGKVKEKKIKKPLSKTSIAIITIVTIICAALLSFGLWYGFGYVDESLSQPITCDKFYSEWMGYLDGEAKLVNVAIPGSHDSGCNGMMPQAMTQGHDIKDQLKSGVRYFDVRVTNKGDDLVIFHGPIKGQSFFKVLGEFNQFLEKNPSEFVIMDFQHLGDKVHQKVINAIKDNMPIVNMLKYSEANDISQVDFNYLRNNHKNFMIVWTAKNDTEINEANDNDFFTRTKSLCSQYDGKIHRKSDEALINQFGVYYANYKSNQLFVLQAQRTAATLLGKPSEYEKKFSPKVNKFVLGIKDDPDLLAKTNIIMRDFSASDLDKTRYTLRLNLYKLNIHGTKGLIKTDLQTDFSKFVEDIAK